jgi:hypothetical protein
VIVSRGWKWLAITLILLLAAVLRFWELGETPPGLHHDEVANWLIARDVLRGNHAIYFTAAYGHEPLYQYVQAASVALFGDHWLGLRWPSVALSLLGIAATYALIRHLFGIPVALLTIAWLTASFWPLFYARVGLRAIALPLTAALAAYFLFRATERGFRDSNGFNWLLAGFFLGLSLYTYMAALILPFILIIFLIYSILIHSLTPIPWSRIFAFLLVAALVSAPLVIWLATHPGAVYRFSEVREPLDRLLSGDPSLVWQNLIANLKFFTFAGDTWPHQNLPGRPVFADPISAVFFYIGVLIALWRWRDPCYGFLLLWLAGALVPSIVTSVAPSSIRNILGLVVVFTFPALALVESLRWIKSQIPNLQFVVRHSSFVILALVPCLFLTARDYFIRWPRNDVVHYAYQADLTAVAHRLGELPPEIPVAVAGLSVHTMDAPSLELASRRNVQDIRLCDTRETLVVPTGENAWLFVPQVVPFDNDLRQRLLGCGARVDPQSSFTSYHLPNDITLCRDLQRLETMATLLDGSSVALPVSFEGRLAFLGYEWLQRDSTPGGTLALLTYWRVESPPPTPLKIFVHLTGEAETPIAQHDGLGSPPHGWATGDLIVQKHRLPLPADLSPGLYTLQLGLYNAPVGPRLSVVSADRLFLSPVEVEEQ